MDIPTIKRQIEKIENELSKDYTQYNRIFLSNKLIDLKQILKRKEAFVLSGN